MIVFVCVCGSESIGINEEDAGLYGRTVERWAEAVRKKNKFVNPLFCRGE